VGIIVANSQGQVLWARRVGEKDAWQFPQGGVHRGESAEQCLFRELHEEIGLRESDVEIAGRTQGWLRYKLPVHMRKRNRQAGSVAFKGQKQKWFLLRLVADDSKIRFDCCGKPEFDGYAWVSYWYPVNQVIEFKREVYRRALRQLAPHLPCEPSDRAGRC
jgi:putative (di)nucleoside polyphosphate hydrolase